MGGLSTFLGKVFVTDYSRNTSIKVVFAIVDLDWETYTWKGLKCCSHIFFIKSINNLLWRYERFMIIQKNLIYIVLCSKPLIIFFAFLCVAVLVLLIYHVPEYAWNSVRRECLLMLNLKFSLIGLVENFYIV